MTENELEPDSDESDFWLVEHPTTDLERGWPGQTRNHTSSQEARKRIIEAAEGIHWHRLSDELPFSPGMVLREVLAITPGPEPLAIGYSTFPTIPIPESGPAGQPLDETDADLVQDGYLVAVRQLLGRTSFSAYFLVLDDEAQIVLLDTRDHEVPEGRTTQMCVAELHQLCRGSAPGPDGQLIQCECGCGCATADPPQPT